MYTVEQFNQRLEDEFGGRLRLRRSLVRDTTFYLEERTGRGTFTGIADLKDKSSLQARRRADDRLRARDGYSKVMEVQVGTKAACTRCGAPYAVPIMHAAEIRCVGCTDLIITSFFPFSDLLIDYLKQRDPEHVDQQRRIREEERREAWLATCEDNSLGNEVGYAYGDALIEQIPAARYSGRTQAWQDAPSGPPSSR